MKTFRKMLCLVLSLIFILSILSTAIVAFAVGEEETQPAEITTSFLNPNGRVLSVAKYGNKRLYPANSLEGINNCIEMGVDAVTVSVQETKDKQLVLLSGADLSKLCVSKADGKTSVAGKVSNCTLEDIQKNYCLKADNGGEEGVATTYGVASLADAIKASKGKILLIVNNGWKYADEINAVAKELEVCDAVILRGAKDTDKISKYITKYGTEACRVIACFDVDNDKGNAKDYIGKALDAGAYIVELKAESGIASIFNASPLGKFESKGRAMISTTKSNLCGDREDRQASWEELIDLGYSMIETDYPRELASYLKQIETYRTELTTLIATAQNIDSSIYTKDSTKVLNDALEEAIAVSSEGCKSLNDLDTARYHIQEALDDLELSDGNDKAHLSTWTWLLIIVGGLLVLAILGLLITKKINKKRREKRRFERFKKTFKSEIPTENDETLTTNIAEDEESNRGLTEEELAEVQSDAEEQPIAEVSTEDVVEGGEIATEDEPIEEKVADEVLEEEPALETASVEIPEDSVISEVMEIEVPAKALDEASGETKEQSLSEMLNLTSSTEGAEEQE